MPAAGWFIGTNNAPAGTSIVAGRIATRIDWSGLIDSLRRRETAPSRSTSYASTAIRHAASTTHARTSFSARRSATALPSLSTR